MCMEVPYVFLFCEGRFFDSLGVGCKFAYILTIFRFSGINMVRHNL